MGVGKCCIVHTLRTCYEVFTRKTVIHVIHINMSLSLYPRQRRRMVIPTATWDETDAAASGMV